MRYLANAGNRHRRATLGTALAAVAFAAGFASPAAGRDATTRVGPGARYVSMGSSFASGPGVTRSADDPANRCARSLDNYAHQLARKRELNLVDVGCSGATTSHVLGPWDELAPQITAVTADSALVTVTIGGNDVGFVRNLIAGACAKAPAPPPGAPSGRCPTVAVPGEADWRALRLGLDRIGAEVRQRAPKARLVFVQYLEMVPATGTCAAVPLDPATLMVVRDIQHRLARATRAAARKWHAAIVDPRDAGVPHDPCANIPWANGFPVANGPNFVPFHPNLAGMTAIADRLDRIVRP